MKSKVGLKSGDPSSIVSELSRLNNKLAKKQHVVAGLPKDSNAYPDGTSVILVGLVHEFGSPARGIPERSYIRKAIKSNTREFKKAVRKTTRSIITGSLSQEQAMSVVGTLLQSKIQEQITTLSTPPLKHRSGNPLIDTGHLRQSITFRVRKGRM